MTRETKIEKVMLPGNLDWRFRFRAADGTPGRLYNQRRTAERMAEADGYTVTNKGEVL